MNKHSIDEYDLRHILSLPKKFLYVEEEYGKHIFNGISVFKSKCGSIRFVYSIDGEIVSALQVMIHSKSKSVATNVYTDTRYRRQGFAKSLFFFAKEKLGSLEYSLDRSEAGKLLVNSVEKSFSQKT